MRSESMPKGTIAIEIDASLTYTYSFHARPKWLAFALEPILRAALQRETRARLRSLKAFLELETGTTR